jgi:hypothetical protein
MQTLRTAVDCSRHSQQQLFSSTPIAHLIGKHYELKFYIELVGSVRVMEKAAHGMRLISAIAMFRTETIWTTFRDVK